MRMMNGPFDGPLAGPSGWGFAMPDRDAFGGFGGWPPGGAAGGAEPVRAYDEAAEGDASDDGSDPTDLGVLEVGTTTITATQQGEPRDVDYVTFTVAEGTVLTGLVIEGYEAEPGNLAFFGIEEGATFDTDPATQDASTLLGGVTYAHWAVGVDVLQIAGDLEGAQGFDGPLEAGEYTLWLNQTGPASTVTIGLELAEADEAPDEGAPVAGPPGGPFAGGFDGAFGGVFGGARPGEGPPIDPGPDSFDFAAIPDVPGGGMDGGVPGMEGGPPQGAMTGPDGVPDLADLPDFLDPALAVLPEDLFLA